MKSGLVVAATLLGAANAGMHRMKLQKVPLEEQLSAANIGDHMRALRHKYTQKIMGGPSEDIFRETSIHPDGPHDVPVENFLNAQCKHAISVFGCQVNRQQISAPLHWEPRLKSSRLSSIPDLPISGSPANLVARLPVISTRNMIPQRPLHTRRTDQTLASAMDPARWLASSPKMFYASVT